MTNQATTTYGGPNRGRASGLPAAFRWLLAVAVLCLAAGVATAQAATQKVVYHINYGDPDRQEFALYNIQNHIRAVGLDEMDVRVVVHSKGVGLLRRAVDDVNLQTMVLNLRHQGVRFEVCGNTLRRLGLDREEDLFEVESGDVVDSGVAELAELQARGFQYIKP